MLVRANSATMCSAPANRNMKVDENLITIFFDELFHLNATSAQVRREIFRFKEL